MIVVVAHDGTTTVDPGTTPGNTGTPGVGVGAGPAPSLAVSITGTDGTVWDLNYGPVYLLSGVNLVGTPPVTNWWKTSPMIDGARWQGMRTEQRDVLLPVGVSGSDSTAWRNVDAQFFASIAGPGEVLVNVATPAGEARSLRCRFVSDGNVVDDFDPLWQAWKSYAIELVAGQPFWEGDIVAPAPFSVTGSQPFFPGPPFQISPTTAVTPTGVTVTNPGDLPTWPRYTITGPVATFSIGVGSALVASSTPLADGEQVIINSSPAFRTIVNEAGDRVFEQMSTANFAAIPPGTNVPLTVAITGFTTATKVAVEFTPLYRRPW